MSNNPKLNKFKPGDKVVTAYNNVYTVKKPFFFSGSWSYTCHDCDGMEMTFDEDRLKFFYNAPNKPQEQETLPEVCPLCQSPWKRTPYGYNKVWYDCLKCNLTAEEAMEKSKKPANPVTFKYY